MSLAVGTRLGSYEIVSALGAGGMGEVFRARDTKLNREVALKVLPDAFTRDPDRLARFKREAQVLASLNHPHIGAIYGFEDSGETHALVLELVEGDTLADRLQRGALPVEEALTIAVQIAEALEAAHEKGIVHRDLKPANVKVTPDGQVKVLDFGLARALEVEPGAAVNLTHSPTLSLLATQAGMILGTAAYMSPEQAKGAPADHRSDVFSFGCVLYEMLTGRQPFHGETAPEVMASVLVREADLTALPPNLNPRISELLRRCLDKNPKRRWQAVGDLRAELEVIGATPRSAPASAVVGAPIRPLWQRIAALTAGALVVAAAATTLTWVATRPAPPRVERFTIAPAGTAALRINGADRDLAITPDGTRVIYVGNNGTQLFVRPLDQLEPRAIATGSALRGVFASPDGQWVGFVDGGSVLKKVAITGGPTVTVAQMNSASRGATWAPDDTIIFATTSPATGLQRVSAAGGEPTLLTTPDRERGEGDHFWPEFLPGGEAVVFTITPATGGIENSQIALLDLQTGTSKVLIRGGSHAHYVATGHLVYGFTGTLRAVAFDLGRLAVGATPAPVLEGVVTTRTGAAAVGVAANGSLVYVPGSAGGGGQQTVVSVDRQGRASPLPGLPLDSYRDVRMSPDGVRLALATQDDVWTYDFTRATLSRLTTDRAPGRSPLWTLDGQRIVFTSQRAGYPELFWRPADGTGSDERFLARSKDLTDLRANGWSADGRQLLFTEVSGTSAVWQMVIERPSDAKVLVKSDSASPVSPDGGWMAYQSNVSGRPEIYVERYPALGNRQQISTGGGTRPLWSRDGRELFFASPEGRQMFAVAVQSGTTLIAGRPQVLFESAMFVAPGGRPYDIAPDGRFLIIRSGEADAGGATAPHIVVVQNWTEELKRLVPVN